MIIALSLLNQNVTTMKESNSKSEFFNSYDNTAYELIEDLDNFQTVNNQYTVTSTCHPSSSVVRILFRDEKIVKWKQNVVWISNSMRNKKVKIINGNRNNRSSIKIIHWNGGAKNWEKIFLEIESLLSEYNPDMCFISEANLWGNVDPEDYNIEGYNFHLPFTMNNLGHARLVLLSKIYLNIQICTELVNNEAAMIWTKIGDTNKTSVIIGGLYRQHQLLGRNQRNLTPIQLQREQEQRWLKITKKWKFISRHRKCIVLGDLNLDFLRWDSPEGHLAKMVEMTKDHIETNGFQQLVVGHTRQWTNQANSLIDQIWSNCPERTLKIFNNPRGSSDHNVVGLSLSLKDITATGHNILKRTWKNFNEKNCLEKFRTMDWTDVREETDVNMASSLLEEKIRLILNDCAPLKTIQVRGKYKNWITDDTKLTMSLRDAARNKALENRTDDNWMEYKRLKNQCTNLQRSDKNKHLIFF